MTKPVTMRLEANFDIDQIGDTLEWSFERSDGEGNPIEGIYAGGIYFQEGEKMYLHVKAGQTIKLGRKRFEGFKIVDCCIISRPQLYSIDLSPETPKKAKFAPPSPFGLLLQDGSVSDKQSMPATFNFSVAQFGNATVVPTEPDYYQLERVWESHLTIGQSNGRWELSLVLTVEITRADGITEMRVFGFDPESEVGSTSNPPR